MVDLVVYFHKPFFLVLRTAVTQTKCFSSRGGAALYTAHAGFVYRGLHRQFCGPHPAAGGAVCFASAQTQVLPPQPVRPCLSLTDRIFFIDYCFIFTKEFTWSFYVDLKT